MPTKKVLATKLDILEFIMRRKLISPYELAEKFYYSEKSILKLLHRLKKAGLIINMTRGSWELTEEWLQKVKILR
jgi:DNA-binding MarR family transcriptional regulator